jgi:heat shock protein HslJ
VRIERTLLWLCAVGMSACAAPSGGPALAGAPASLAGTRWLGVIDASVDSRSTPWLEFLAEGRMSGFTGCNLLNGGWKSEGGQVRIGPLAMTKRACMGPAGDIERRVLASLNDQARVNREGAKLVMVGPSGERFEFTEAR